MAVHKIRKGLDLPISGAPKQVIEDAPQPSQVAITADDFIGMKPRMLIQVGDTVKLGQKLLEDRKSPGVFYTAPGAGKINAVNRGARRVLQSVVIDLGGNDAQSFESYTSGEVADLSREEVAALLQESGAWIALRTRPFSKVPAVDSTPHSIFVTAVDTNPLAPSVDVIVEGREDDFERGLVALSKLTDGKVYLCKSPGSKVAAGQSGVQVEEFSGKHPAGTVGVHIHTLDPVHRGKTVWHLGYQDVLAIGKLFKTGELDVTRVVSVAGPAVKEPRLLRTRLGAKLDSLTGNGSLRDGDNRIISGSVLNGHKAQGEVFGFLTRYVNQVSVLAEGRERVFLGWLTPGLKSFSTVNIYLSKLFGKTSFDFTTTTNGSPRAMVPIGSYERVMPLDIMPTHLLRALIIGDVEWAEELGCLELDEEDLALCTFVCSGKTDYGPALRKVLNQIDKEG